MLKKSLSEEVTFGQRPDYTVGEGQVTIWGRAFQAEGTTVPVPRGREFLGPRTSMEPMWLEWSERGPAWGDEVRGEGGARAWRALFITLGSLGFILSNVFEQGSDMI